MNRKQLAWLHHIHAIALMLLLVTGVSLYFSFFRTLFNEWKIPLVAIHIWIAIFYMALVLFTVYYALQYSKRRAPIKKFNSWLFIFLFFLWAVSGVLMYFQQYVPVWVRNHSVVIHDWSTWIVIPWIFFHGLGYLFNIRIPWPDWWRGRKQAPEWITENKLERREVTKVLLIFPAFILLGGWIRWLSPLLSVPETEEKRSGYFRIYNVTNDYPRYKEQEWKLTIEDLDRVQKEFTMKDMRQLTWYSIVDDFHCVTGWSVRGVELRGIYVKDLLAEYYVNQPKDTYVTAHSGDGIYYDSFTISQLLDEDAMLIFELDGLPLKKSQGFPCRLYHPGMYGYKSVKWLTRFELTTEREHGYWQTNGDYDLNGYL